MSKDIQLDEFLKQYIEPAVKPHKPATEIMVLGPPSFLGPRLDLSRKGAKRWVTRLNRRPDLARFQTGYPVQ